MPKIESLELRVRNPRAQRHFYQRILGMHDLGDGRIGYSQEEAGICFLLAETAYAPQTNDVYWKIALAVPNIELAYAQLTEKGVMINEPKQFKDIGYLAHFQDPEGFTIELIEHHFLGDRPNASFDGSRLGGGAHLNLITLRTADIHPADKMVKQWGMKPLSIQPVENRGFTLYFYAFTDDTPPSADLHAIENRTWLYQRPYSVLEIQSLDEIKPSAKFDERAAGYHGITLSSCAELIEGNELRVSSPSYRV